MVRIRYTELPAGLHVAAQTRGGDTVVYLQPGLTAAERRVALTRVRSLGRMGHGPRLSASSMARAASADRVRTTVGNGAAAVRGHPILLLPSAVVMSGTCFALVSLAAVSLHIPDVKAVEAAFGLRAGPTSHHSTQQSHRQAYVPRHARGIASREQLPSTDWSSSSSPPPGASCVVYGLFGVCENS